MKEKVMKMQSPVVSLRLYGAACICLLFASITLTTVANAQLTRTSTSSYSGCNSTFGPPNLNVFSNWAFKDSSGVSHAFSGTDFTELQEGKFVHLPNGPTELVHCGASLTTALTTLSSDREFYLQATGGTGTVDSAAVVYPKYKIASIVYAAPGNASSAGYTNSATNGTTSSITQSFTAGATVTFTTGFSFFGVGATSSASLGSSQTNGSSSGFTETLTNASGVNNVSGGATNQINHKNDLFLLWINPAIELVSTGSGAWLYSTGTQLQGPGDPSPGSPEVQDIVEVFASALEANTAGVSTVPAAILNPQIIDGQMLPGLASICANVNKTEYSAGKCTLADQCGCVPNDFKTILAQDPLLNFSSTESPLNANASGTACASPTASDKCRYVPVPTAAGSSVQETELLSGPDTSGGNRPVNSFTQTNSTTSTQTFSESNSYTVGYSFGISFFGSGFSSSTQWTWTDGESSGLINGAAQSMAVSLSSTTVGCNQQIPVFEDTVYHTFVFQQPTGNTSCP